MDSIILIAQQLKSEGKVPSTALIKSRLTIDVSLPMIIRGLKMWKENPDKEINQTTEPTPTNATKNETLEQLITLKVEQAIAPLKAEIIKLKTEIKRLNKLTTEDKK